MAKTKRKEAPGKAIPPEGACCGGSGSGCCDSAEACCKVESVVSLDERGQMVLPKEARDKLGVKPGEKLAVFSWNQRGTVCCIGLMKVDRIEEMLEETLGPVLAGLRRSA